MSPPGRRPAPLRPPPANLARRPLPLHLVDPAVDGAWMRLFRCAHASELFFGQTGDDYPQTQAWSRALWSHPQQPGGLYYRARHDLSRLSIALFDRAARQVAEVSHGSLAADRNRRHRVAILSTYRVNLF